MVEMKARTELTEIAEKVKENPGEFDYLILKWSSKVNLKGWVTKKTFNHADADDLMQEVLINISTRFDEYDSARSNFETWAWNRCRQVIRSWIRSQIKEANPVLKKGYNGQSIRGKVFGMPEDFDVAAPDVDNYEGFEMFVKSLNKNLERIQMMGSNVETTKRTLELLAEDKPIKEIAKVQGISKSKVMANIKRIRKAAMMFLEEPAYA